MLHITAPRSVFLATLSLVLACAQGDTGTGGGISSSDTDSSSSSSTSNSSGDTSDTTSTSMGGTTTVSPSEGRISAARYHRAVTWSIVAVDAATAEMGIAVASCVPLDVVPEREDRLHQVRYRRYLHHRPSS